MKVLFSKRSIQSGKCFRFRQYIINYRNLWQFSAPLTTGSKFQSFTIRWQRGDIWSLDGALTFIAGDWLPCSSRGLFPTARWILDINEKDDQNHLHNEWDHIVWVTILLQKTGIKIHQINKSLGNQQSHICSTVVSSSSYYLWITVSHYLCFIFQIYVLISQTLWQSHYTVKQ